MAWNQEPPGSQPGGKQPWGRKPSGARPPGLDDFLNKLGETANRLFGGQGPVDRDVLKLIAGVLLAVWGVFGFYRVEQAERAVVFRFGEFHAVEQAGLHWYAPFIESIKKVNVSRPEQLPLNATMITEDENIVDISLSVQYRVRDAKQYVLAISGPESALAHATESALRHVVGSLKMTQVLNEGRAEIAQKIQPRLQSYLDRYRSGLVIDKVNVLEALPPKDVKAAFDDVINAKEDGERLKNQAQTYANGIVPEARGQAARLVAEGAAYRQEVVSRATGDAARFDQLLTEYSKAPQVTRQRLYLETMEGVMSRSTKVVVDGQGAQPFIYLPLDRTSAPTVSATPPAELQATAAAARDARKEAR